MEIGEKIKNYLKKVHMTQTRLADLTQIPLPKLNLALSGRRKMRFEEYELICGVLGVGTDMFLTPRLPKQDFSC